MTEAEAKAFFDGAYRFAKSRRAPEGVCVEYPAYAWEKLYVKKWKCSMLNVWRNFVRDQFGAKTSKKNNVESSIRFRRIYWSQQDLSDFLENAVSAPEQERLIQFRSLPMRQRMIACLLQCGFDLSEIHSEFGKEGRALKSEKQSLQKAMQNSLEAEETLGKNLDPLMPSEIKKERALRKRKRAAASQDWSSHIERLLGG